MKWLDSLRLANKAEKRGQLDVALKHLDEVYDDCPAEMEEMIGTKIQQIEARWAEQKRQQRTLFQKAKAAVLGGSA